MATGGALERVSVLVRHRSTSRKEDDDAHGVPDPGRYGVLDQPESKPAEGS